jgi:hypothetical protein
MLDKSASSVEVIKWRPGQSVEGMESKLPWPFWLGWIPSNVRVLVSPGITGMEGLRSVMYKKGKRELSCMGSLTIRLPHHRAEIYMYSLFNSNNANRL